MKKIFLTMIAVAACTVTVMAQCVYPTDNVTIKFKRKAPGLLDGEFSVAAGKKVQFSGGNLQYIGSAAVPYFKIASHQYDYLGSTTGQNSAATNVDRDFLGWATSGWNNTSADATSTHYQPWQTCKTNHGGTYNPYQYGPTISNVTANQSWSKLVGVNHPYENYDWGVYNTANLGTGWRTLTSAEWEYVYKTRETGKTVNGTPNARYTFARILTDGTGTSGLTYNICGVILFPDDYNGGTPSGVNWGTINGASSWTTTCNTAGWAALEEAGCVFLPAAGDRDGTNMENLGVSGHYWSSTVGSQSGAWLLRFANNKIETLTLNRYYGFSVRLVQDVE